MDLRVVALGKAGHSMGTKKKRATHSELLGTVNSCCMLAASAVACCMLFVGCSGPAALGGATPRAESIRLLDDYSEDAHWISNPVRIDEVTDLGQVRDPRLEGGDLVVEVPADGNYPFELFARMHVKRVFEATFSGPISKHLTKKAGFIDKNLEENGDIGFDEYAIPENINKQCMNFLDEREQYMDSLRAQIAQGVAQTAPSDAALQRFSNLRKCFSVTKIRSAEPVIHSYLLYEYVDAERAKHGFGVFVTEIRNPVGKVILRGATCFSNYRLRRYSGIYCRKGNIPVFDLNSN